MKTIFSYICNDELHSDVEPKADDFVLLIVKLSINIVSLQSYSGML